ncbi:NADP-dependent malic enzyme [Coprothermobacter proteolyticus]|nr:NADP-dependent malic enzyme [Coprothermobacter proteolyticus]
MEITPSFLHKLYRGKWELRVRIPLARNLHVFYTPGVAEPCQNIAADNTLVWDMTNRWNTIGVISNGTRILGLGNIGPEAGLPVMEGKAVLYKYYAGIDAIPLCIRAETEETILAFLSAIEPSLGGINLEDIKQPDAFNVLTEARKFLRIPIIHDDMEGTGIIMLAAVLASSSMAGLKLENEKIVLLGAGSANMGFLQLLDELLLGNIGNVIVVDRDLVYNSENSQQHWMGNILSKTNKLGSSNLEEALKGASFLIAASRPGPGVFPLEYLRNMKKPNTVLSLANPVPEVSREEACAMGVTIYGSGRSDDPNQVNNSLIFPGLMLGLLVTQQQYNTAVGIEVAKALSELAMKKQRIVPQMDSEVHQFVARTVVEHFSKKCASKENASMWAEELNWRMNRK